MHWLSHSVILFLIWKGVQNRELQTSENREQGSERKQQKTKRILSCPLCVCVCEFFFSLCVSLWRAGGGTWTLLSAPAGVHRTIHTHTRILAHSTAATAVWMSAKQRARKQEWEREREREGRRRRRNRWSCYLLLLVFQCEDWGLRMILLLLPLQQRDLVWGEHYNPTFFF